MTAPSDMQEHLEPDVERVVRRALNAAVENDTAAVRQIIMNRDDILARAAIAAFTRTPPDVWMPIDSAPKPADDETRIYLDLWTSTGHRVCDAYWLRTEQAWWAPGQDYLDGGPVETNGEVVTHWRYPPASPNAATPQSTTAAIQTVEQLRAYARRASIVLMRFSGGGSEMFERIGDEFYAEPERCEERFQHKQATIARIEAKRSAQSLSTTTALDPGTLCKCGNCLDEHVPDGTSPDCSFEAASPSREMMLEEALREIAEYTGDGPPSTPWQSIVRDMGERARQALATSSRTVPLSSSSGREEA